MKHLWLFIFMALAFQSKATNDTLTRAQVYNFNVGDTFDYRHYFLAYVTGSGHETTSVNYTRYAILNNYYSIDSSTKFIVRQQLLPPTLLLDTITLQNLSGFEVFLDTEVCYSAGIQSAIITINGSSQYNNRITNGCFAYCNYPISKEQICGEGLGQILVYIPSGTQVSGFTYDSTLLVYYSKGSEKWGTPANILMSINDITASITLSPTINNGQFNIQITNGNSASYQLLIYDLMGREIERTTLKNDNNNTFLSNTSKGMYLWSVLSGSIVLSTGKLVVQ